MSVHLLRCRSTYYRVEDNKLAETTREETTGYLIRKGGRNHEPYIYLHNSAASAPVNDLIAGAHKGGGWMAQVGHPPAYVEGEGWFGRSSSQIYVPADALLELEAVLNVQEKEAA